MTIKFLSITTSLLVSTAILSVTITTPARALTPETLNVVTSCPSTSTVSYSGSLSIDEPAYDVYVRLAAEGQRANVTLYNQPTISDECHEVGMVAASGDEWVKVGSVTSLDTSAPTLFQLSSSAFSSTLDAKRPSVMLVSQIHPACIPTTECFVSVGSEHGYVRTPGTLPTENSLHIVQAIDPDRDTIEKVEYYTGTRLAYTTSLLHPFELRYVSRPSESLTRVVYYASGQRVVIASQAPASFVPTLGQTVFRLFFSYATLSWAYIIALLVTAGAAIGLLAVRSYRHNYRWISWYKDTRRRQQYRMLSDADRRVADRKQVRVIWAARGLTGVISVGIGFLMIVSINTFGATLYTVSGHSMDSSFVTGNEEFVNKLPVTLAHLQGTNYVPARGSVVILHAMYGIGQSDTLLKESDIIKRVIGLPGERVVVKNGAITVYNDTHPGGFDPDAGAPWQATMHVSDVGGDIDVTLKENELFICGDNRPVSIDSRFNGPISTNEVVGVVAFKV